MRRFSTTPSSSTTLLLTTTTLFSVCCCVLTSSLVSSSSSCSSMTSTSECSSSTTSSYPGTSEKRLQTILKKVHQLDEQKDLTDQWSNIRKKLLTAGGLRHDVRETSHSFNDWNHCDLTPMKTSTFDFENEGRVQGMHPRNHLGHVIRKCSLTKNDADFGDDDDGGSWTTCLMNCNTNPPRDVAHIQFQSKIAFKLVWLPPSFDKFALVDDDGNVLKVGENLDKEFPRRAERRMNFEAVHGKSGESKYTKNLEKYFGSSF